MTSNVLTMPGFLPPAVEGEPVLRVVECLEAYLEMAKNGSLTAVAVAAVVPDSTRKFDISTAFECSSGTTHVLENAINAMKRRYERYLDEE